MIDRISKKRRGITTHKERIWDGKYLSSWQKNGNPSAKDSRFWSVIINP